MSPAPRRARVWLGWMLGAAFLAALLWTTLAQSGRRVRGLPRLPGGVRLPHGGGRATPDAATQQAIASACAILSRGVTQGLECQRTPPRSLRCDEP